MLWRRIAVKGLKPKGMASKEEDEKGEVIKEWRGKTGAMDSRLMDAETKL